MWQVLAGVAAGLNEGDKIRRENEKNAEAALLKVYEQRLREQDAADRAEYRRKSLELGRQRNEVARENSQAAIVAKAAQRFQAHRDSLAAQVKAGTVTPTAANASLRQAAKDAGVNPGPAFQAAPEKPAKLRLVPSYSADGKSVTWVEGKPGTVTHAKPPKPTAAKPYKPMSESQIWSTVDKRLKLKAPIDKGGAKDDAGRPIPDGLDDVTGKPMAEARGAYGQLRQAEFDKLLRGEIHRTQMDPARGGGSGGGVSTMVDTDDEDDEDLDAEPVSYRDQPITLGAVPARYEDTALTPEFEQHATDLSGAFPRAVITSRARSRDRNTKAGGAASSYHLYRSAFDVDGLHGRERAAAIRWGKARGLHVLDEGDHLHFEPAAERRKAKGKRIRLVTT